MIALPGSYTKNQAVVDLDTARTASTGGTRSTALCTAQPPCPPHRRRRLLGVPRRGRRRPCNDPTQPCSTSAVQNRQYASTVIKQIQQLHPGPVVHIPGIHPGPRRRPEVHQQHEPVGLHLAESGRALDDVTVRYCYSRLQQIIQAIATTPNITSPTRRGWRGVWPPLLACSVRTHRLGVLGEALWKRAI